MAQRLLERKRRIRLIRLRVAAIATATFLATSTGILVQLVSGNDPALAKSSATKATTVASAASGTSGSGSGTSSRSSSSAQTPVTTSAS